MTTRTAPTRALTALTEPAADAAITVATRTLGLPAIREHVTDLAAAIVTTVSTTITAARTAAE